MLHVWAGGLATIGVLLLAVGRLRVLAPLPLAIFAVYMGSWIGATMAMPPTALSSMIAVGGIVFGFGFLAVGAWCLAVIAWILSLREAGDQRLTFRRIALRAALVPILFLLAAFEVGLIVYAYVVIAAPELLEAPPSLH
jgi:hypothetical protein